MSTSHLTRLPPGQVLTAKFPILHYGTIPPFDPDSWTFRVFGEVEERLEFSYSEFTQLPKVEIVADVHCVTRWSRFDNRWEGVTFKELMSRIKPRAEARFVMVHADGGYAANLPLDVLLDEDVLFAYRLDGDDLRPEHGWPLRLVVPKKYFWKSVKWVRSLEFMSEDRYGFWELRGYHNDADPWQEQRYSEE
ncbi:MAG: sulfite oxidase-like oxidoreductase [Chloroflexi bacterium]|nr:sulfite oxidase-like oxidoreductase [Chloroflexota bacterium]MDA8189167.1 sulfite oxidase-like oxidoreductase [Dehalococcoidales bacterium]